MRMRWSHGFGLSLAILMLVVAGCAKRPATTQASAPAPPTEAAQAPAPERAAAPPSPAPTPRGPVAQPEPAVAGPTPSAAAPTARPELREFTTLPELADIYFDFDQYDIRPGDAKILDANAQVLGGRPEYVLLIEGHADERGTNAYNLALAERRAKATMNYLVSLGVPASRITILSYGEERPQCRAKSESCWAQNRRAHFLVKQSP